MQPRIYLFSGLGADQRVFQDLDIPGFKLIHVNWLKPQPKESMKQYASRIALQITVPAAAFIGLSFGGMMAIEVGKIVRPAKLIIISSARDKKEVPWYYRIAGKLGLHNLLPVTVLKQSNFVTNWFFGARSVREQKLLAAILKDTDPAFLKWAMGEIISWKNEEVLPGVSHIHGSADKILPLRFVKADIVIKSGGHFMILNKAVEINPHIQKLLG